MCSAETGELVLVVWRWSFPWRMSAVRGGCHGSCGRVVDCDGDFVDGLVVDEEFVSYQLAAWVRG